MSALPEARAFGELPEPIRIRDTVASVATHVAPDPDEPRDNGPDVAARGY